MSFFIVPDVKCEVLVMPFQNPCLCLALPSCRTLSHFNLASSQVLTLKNAVNDETGNFVSANPHGRVTV